MITLDILMKVAILELLEMNGVLKIPEIMYFLFIFWAIIACTIDVFVVKKIISYIKSLKKIAERSEENEFSSWWLYLSFV